MKIKRTLKSLAVAGAIGAAASYVLDPVAGRRRREAITRGIERRASDVRDLARKAGRAREAIVPDSSEPESEMSPDHVRRADAVDPTGDLEIAPGVTAPGPASQIES